MRGRHRQGIRRGDEAVHADERLRAVLRGGRGQCANCSKCVNDKTGDCAQCWEAKSTRVLSGLLASQYMLSCLGNEAPDGGAPKEWPKGTGKKLWSPGCQKCWADKDACTPSER